jgi:hypothetical protein
MAEDHYKAVEDAKLVPDGPNAVEEARKLHHLASADPEPERDGLLTGAAHELKYGLERAEATIAEWRARGVHPTENRRLVPGDEGYEQAVESGQVPAEGPIETAQAPVSPDNAAAPRASD